MTVLELVHGVAAEHGVTISDDEADAVLWEHTGFPAFWLEEFDAAEAALRHQLHELFEGAR